MPLTDNTNTTPAATVQRQPSTAEGKENAVPPATTASESTPYTYPSSITTSARVFRRSRSRTQRRGRGRGRTQRRGRGRGRSQRRGRGRGRN